MSNDIGERLAKQRKEDILRRLSEALFLLDLCDIFVGADFDLRAKRDNLDKLIAVLKISRLDGLSTAMSDFGKIITPEEILRDVFQNRIVTEVQCVPINTSGVGPWMLIFKTDKGHFSAAVHRIDISSETERWGVYAFFSPAAAADFIEVNRR